MKTYSQNGQDRVVIELFGGATNLYFVELGAGNGLDLSNTLLLEQDYGWTGLLVEANPRIFQALQINRPNTTNVNALLWHEAGKNLKFWLRDGWMSRIIDQGAVTNPPESRKAHQKLRRAQATGNVIELETETLRDVLDQRYNGPSIDFMSVDLEGAEDAALLDFPAMYSQAYHPRCLCIERPSKNLSQRLKDNNYLLWGNLGEDTMFIHKESGLI